MKASGTVNGQPLPVHHLLLPLPGGALPRLGPEGFPVLLGKLATLPPLPPFPLPRLPVDLAMSSPPFL